MLYNNTNLQSLLEWLEPLVKAIFISDPYENYEDIDMLWDDIYYAAGDDFDIVEESMSYLTMNTRTPSLTWLLFTDLVTEAHTRKYN